VSTSDQLDALLASWASANRITDEQASTVHAAILQRTSEAQVELDVEWFWSLLRPVTALLDGPNRLNHTLSGLISVGT